MYLDKRLQCAVSMIVIGFISRCCADATEQATTIMQHLQQPDRMRLETDARLLADKPAVLDQVLDRIATHTRQSTAPLHHEKEVLESGLLAQEIHLVCSEITLDEMVQFVARCSSVPLLIDASLNRTLHKVFLSQVSLADVIRFICLHTQQQSTCIKTGSFFVIIPVSKMHRYLRAQACPAVSSFTHLSHAKWTEHFKLQARSVFSFLQASLGDSTAHLVLDDATRRCWYAGSKRLACAFKKYLTRIDVPVPQVHIQAKIVLARKHFERKLGFNFAGLYDRLQDISSGFQLASIGNARVGGDGGEWSVNADALSDSCGGLRLPFLFGGPSLDTLRLHALLQAAEQEQVISTLLEPSIVTDDKEIAEILEGEVIPIETVVQDHIDGHVRTTQTADFKDVGIQLRVRPDVRPNKKSVRLSIFVENSLVAQRAKRMRHGPQHGSYPTIVTTRTKTNVHLASGQTTVISGLTKRSSSKREAGIPFLRSLPLIGSLFKGKRSSKDDVELLIFITPTILPFDTAGKLQAQDE